MEVLSEHLCQGWLEGYLLTGRHGLFATYEAFAMVSASMAIQHAKWLEARRRARWREPVASLNVLLTSTCWRNDHNGFSHQGPGLIDTMISLRAASCASTCRRTPTRLLSVAEHCLQQPRLRQPDRRRQAGAPAVPRPRAAREHARAGASIWEWASTSDGDESRTSSSACAGDVPTMETLAAAALLRRHTPDLRVRVVNVDRPDGALPADVHPHGLPERAVRRAVQAPTPRWSFAFHGYARAIHQLLHGAPQPGRFHVRGFSEQGTTTTPFDMVVLNEMSRYHLVLRGAAPRAPATRGRRGARGALRLDARAAPRLRPRAPRGHAGDPRLDLGPARWTLAKCARRQRRLEQPEAAAARPRRRQELGLAARDLRARRLRRSCGAIPDQGTGHAVGHRVVHGGWRFTGGGRRGPRDAGRAARACDLAPLHNPPAIAAIEALRRLAPDVAHRGVLRHRLPRHPARRRLRCTRCRRAGASDSAVRRFGFHGLSTHTRRGGRPICWACLSPSSPRRLPPRRGCLAGRDRRRPLAWTRRWASPRSKAW